MAFDKAASRLLTYAIRIDNSIFLNVFCRSMLSKYFASQRSVASPEDCTARKPYEFPFCQERVQASLADLADSACRTCATCLGSAL